MDKIFKNFDRVLSLGTSCFIKSFLQKYGISQETNLFDNIGSPMWGICELFENNFEGLSEIENYDRLNISKGLSILSNKKYYLRFKHEDYMFKNNNVQNKPLSTLFKTLERRADRFKEHLKNNKKVLLVRLEQDDSKRVMYPEYENKNNDNEREYIVKFSQFLKLNYKDLDFFIIYISKKNSQHYDEINNILTLFNKNDTMTWGDCNEKLNSIFLENMDFIKNNLIL